MLLDGRAVRTPARKPLAAPVLPLAQAIAAEWSAQEKVVDPAAMPLTRLANSIIDGVAPAPAPVADEIEKYLGTDMLFYRASEPDGLVALQRQHWDPVVAWARDALGARFVLAEGVMHVAQPREAIAAVRAKISGTNDAAGHWRLGALNVATTITGSALLALALAERPSVAGRGMDRGACRRGLEHAVLGPRRAGAAAPRLPPQGVRRGGAVLAALSGQ